LDAEPESVGRARTAVAELATSLGIREPRLADAKTIVSEACSNVIRHAYPEEAGSFELEAFSEKDELKIVVRDFGVGMRPRISESSTLQLGLGLISMLSSHFEICGPSGGGTEVRIAMALGA
jgi:anti-sigma regulatory factor (Ser/Thr protein kinase)